RDVAALPDLLHGRAGAGPVRTHRPVYLDLLPPCNAGCPAGENIPAWLAQIQAGRPEQAWRELVRDNPLPAIHGRVCYHPCESKGFTALRQVRGILSVPPATDGAAYERSSYLAAIRQ